MRPPPRSARSLLLSTANPAVIRRLSGQNSAVPGRGGLVSAHSFDVCMEIEHASLSVAGPVRPHNEDCVGFWQPSDESGWRDRGAVVVLADGVGGQDKGEVASRLACDAAVSTFTAAKADTAPGQLLWQLFNAANLAVYDENLRKNGSGGRMATTLTVSVFRHNQVDIGHVGDCRVYVIQQNRCRRVTNDHSYAGVQLKLGLITVQDSLASELRSVLTRTVG